MRRHADKHRHSAVFWRSGRDSNPRVVAHKLISSQPRYDRFDTAAYLIFKHRPARHLEKCKISMQDNKGKFRCAPEEKPAVKPFLADKLTKGRESFECRTFDHSDNSPCISTVFRALRKCKKNRQERYEILKFDPAKTLINQGF